MRMPLSRVRICDCARLQLSARAAATRASSAFTFAACSASAFLRRASRSGSTVFGASAAEAVGAALEGATEGADAVGDMTATRDREVAGRDRMFCSGTPGGGGRSLYCTWPRWSRHFHCACAGAANARPSIASSTAEVHRTMKFTGREGGASVGGHIPVRR